MVIFMNCDTCIYRQATNKNKQFKKNEFIFLEGDKVTSIYFIKKGTVILSKLHTNGEEKIMDVLKEGDFIALLTILQDKEEYLVSAKASTEVIVEVTKREDALHNYRENTQFKETCIKCASHRLNNFYTQLFSTSNIDPEEKIIQVLKHLYKKFGYMKNKRHYVKLPISKTELAQMIGLRRETLSRKLTLLKQMEIIDIEKNIYEIKDM